MTGEEAGEPPKISSLADLVVPRRPAGIPYGDGDDYDARALLEENSYDTETSGLLSLLDSDLGILQAAAARTLGAKGATEATAALERLATDAAAEETARVQAAYALARLGVPRGREILLELLELSPEASPAPLQAAGALASLGDPGGFPVVRSALESENPVTAMIACKQLSTFVPLDGSPVPGGDVVDAFGGLARALQRPEPRIAGEARAQLEALATDAARATLAEHRPAE